MKSLWRSFFITLVLIFSTLSASAEILRFVQVDQTIFRGSQPENKMDYDRLQELGVKYVFNLRDDYREIQWEKQELDKRGIVLMSYPMSPWDKPNPRTIKQMLLQIQQASQLGGVYIHCHHGKDRTGIVMGLYRIHFQGWDRMKAYSEMASLGFNHIFWDMQDFFWKYSLPRAFDKVQ